MFKCQYCYKEYTTKPHLTRHQKTAKKCLVIQETPVTKAFKCKGCTISFILNHHLTNHRKTCIEYAEAVLSEEYEEKLFEMEDIIESKDRTIKDNVNIIKDKDDIIKKLKDRITQQDDTIKELKRPNIVNNTTNINNIIYNDFHPITNNLLDNNSSKLTIAHLNGGSLGCARYAIDNPLKDNIHCSDTSRRVLKYKDEKGNVIKDPRGIKLGPRLFSSIKDQGSRLLYKAYTDTQEHKEFTEDEKVKRIEEITNLQTELNQSSRGEDTALVRETMARISELAATVSVS
jgi:hypothetical protein